MYNPNNACTRRTMKPASVRSPAGEVLKRATRYFIRERAAYFTGFAFGKRVERLSSQTCKTSCRKFYFYLSNGLLSKQVSITQYKKLVTFCDLYEKVLWKYTRTLIISQTGTLFGLPHCWISSTIWVRLQHGDPVLRTEETCWIFENYRINLESDQIIPDI